MGDETAPTDGPLGRLGFSWASYYRRMGVGNPAFDQYQLSEEQQLLRKAVRQLSDDKIAPRAAEVDETAEFPHDVLDALVRAGFHAVHIPEEYGGMGADAISSCIVIEEVARACASSSLIPAVNKLGSQPIILSGAEPLKQQVLGDIASGRAMISYALSEREAGSDAASMRTKAVLDGDHWVLNGTKCWITNAGVSTYYTVMAVTAPTRARTVSPPSSCTRTTRASRSAPRSASSASRAARPARSTSRTARSRPIASSASPAPASRPRCARSTTPGWRSARRRSASRRAPWTRRSLT